MMAISNWIQKKPKAKQPRISATARDSRLYLGDIRRWAIDEINAEQRKVLVAVSEAEQRQPERRLQHLMSIKNHVDACIHGMDALHSVDGGT